MLFRPFEFVADNLRFSVERMSNILMGGALACVVKPATVVENVDTVSAIDCQGIGLRCRVVGLRAEWFRLMARVVTGGISSV